MKYTELKKGMVVELTCEDDKSYLYTVMVLPVVKKDLKTMINATHEGLYGFRGFWYGSDRNKHKNYGKIFDLSLFKDTEIKLIKQNTVGLTNKQLRTLID